MSGAAARRERLSFQVRDVMPDDGFGNREDKWRTKFQMFARVQPLRGSETVIAARLAGTQPYVITVESCRDSRSVTPGWRAVDAREPQRIFNIRSAANFDERNRLITFTAETGVPT